MANKYILLKWFAYLPLESQANQPGIEVQITCTRDGQGKNLYRSSDPSPRDPSMNTLSLLSNTYMTSKSKHR